MNRLKKKMFSDLNKIGRITLNVFSIFLFLFLLTLFFVFIHNTSAALGGGGVSKNAIKALEKDNSKFFDNITREMTIKNDKIKSIPTDDIVRIKPLKPHENPVFPGRGYQNKSVYSFDVQAFIDYPFPFKDMEFYNLNHGGARFYRPYYLAYENITGTKSVPVYGVMCRNVTATANATWGGGNYSICDSEQVSSRTENVTDFVKIESGSDLDVGNYTIHVMTYILPNDKVEFIPVWFNQKMPEYGIWYSALDTNLRAFYKLNETSGNRTNSVNTTYNFTRRGAAVDNNLGIGLINNSWRGNISDANLNASRVFGDSENITVSVWMNATQFSGGARLWGAVPMSVFEIDLRNCAQSEQGICLRWNSITGSSVIDTVNATWVHFVWTAQNNRNVTLWLNNNVVLNFSAGTFTNLTEDIILSSRGDDSPLTENYSVDEIGIWTRILNASEIGDLYNNGTGITYTIAASDTTSPNITLVSPTPSAGVYINDDNFTINVTSADETGLQNITVRVFWSNDTLRVENTSTVSPFNITYTLSDGLYRYNVTAADTSNNLNYTATRNITIDTIFPAIIFNDTGSGASDANGVNVSRNWTFMNVTANDTNEANITFSLYYTNGTSVNVTTFTDARRVINWTNLANGRYNFNASIVDFSNNRNNTETRNITIDAIFPTIIFNDTGSGATSVDGASTSRSWVFVNVTANDTNEANITYSLYYTNGTRVNVTTFTTSVRVINWTGLTSGRYNYNVSIVDFSNNRNNTATRNITLDQIDPYINLTYPLNTSYTTIQTTLNYTVNDSNIQACWYSTDGGVTNTTVTCGNNVTGLSSGQGSSTWRVYANDTAGLQNSSNVTFFVDSIFPTIIFNDTGTGATSVNYANVSRSWVFVNVTANDTNEANITFTLYYTNGTSVNVTTFSTAVRTINWTSLSDGDYNYNVSIVDSLNNRNNTETRNITLDTTLPIVNFTTPTPVNNTNSSDNDLAINVTVTETNFRNITYELYNNTANYTLVNRTTFTNTSYFLNFTSLVDTVYFYNVTVVDDANNRNTTELRTYRVDTAAPTITVNSPVNNTVYYTTNIIFNITTSETNTVSNRTFAVLNRDPNTTFNGYTTYSAPFGSYNVVFCSRDDSNNLRCSPTISFSTQQDPFTSTGGGGGGGGDIESIIDTSFNKILVIFDKEWDFDINQSIRVETLDVKEKLLDIDFIDIKLLNNTTHTSSQIFRIKNGTYEKTFNINQTNLSSLTFDIRTRKGLIVKNQTISIKIQEIDISTKTINEIQLDFLKSYNKFMIILSDNKELFLISSIIFINLILVYYLFRK